MRGALPKPSSFLGTRRKLNDLHTLEHELRTELAVARKNCANAQTICSLPTIARPRHLPDELGGERACRFERYTEKARRAIFFARYEASLFGSPYIETEHLPLGLLREDKALTNRFLRSHASVESIRKQIEGHTAVPEKVQPR